MLDLMIARKRHPRLTAFRAAVEAWPNLPPATPDHQVSMHSNRTASDSDQCEDPTDDVEHYLSVLSSPERTRGGPYL